MSRRWSTRAKKETSAAPIVGSANGSSVILRCPYTKSCASSTKVSWRRNGKEVSERRNYEGRDTVIWIRTTKKKRSGVGELIFYPLRAADEGIYACRISNSIGTVDHNITVRTDGTEVVSRPRIQEGMSGSHSVPIGSSLTLECNLTVPHPSLVLWYHHYQKSGSWKDENGKYYARVVQDSRELPHSASE